MSAEAAKPSLHSLILPLTEYCFTIWSFAGVTTQKPIEQLQTKKPYSSHHCAIIDLLSFEQHACFIYKCLSGLAPPLQESSDELAVQSVPVQSPEGSARSNVSSVKGYLSWNSIPTFIRKSSTFAALKKYSLKLHKPVIICEV